MLAALLLAVSCCDQWTLAQDTHFQIYSQTGEVSAQRALGWFERLHSFFVQTKLLGSSFDDKRLLLLHVVGFRSTKEYDEYRTHPVADAYYAFDGSGDYIVMASLEDANFEGTAAHEYFHYVAHASGLKLPDCFSEGLAEYFSTLRSYQNGYHLGGDLPARMQTLRKRKWLPLAELIDSSNESDLADARKRAEIFYAESWALVDMLVTSSEYSGQTPEFLSQLQSGAKPAQAFLKCYGVTVAEVEKSLEKWVGHTRPAYFAANKSSQSQVSSSTLSNREAESLLARVSLVSGHLEAARIQYEVLQREEPENAEFAATLGAIAERQGQRDKALAQWGRALDKKVTDPELCYRYALLAEEAGQQKNEKAALERAVALAPGFDDARYKLALIESQAGDYASAVVQLRAIRVPSGSRSFAYWIAVGAALTELDKRDEAKEAAQNALKSAQNDEERLQARRMAYMAATDLTVQFSTDAEGRSQMVTTRIPHGTTVWNPFVEATDHMEHSKGTLSQVLCAGGNLTGFVLRTSAGSITMEVTDPKHVLMRNSPNEFFCGPTAGKVVQADYAVTQIAGKTRNVLRGMTFDQAPQAIVK